MRKFARIRRTNWGKSLSKYVPLVAAVLVFAAVGTIFMLNSQAATPTASLEAENGTVSSAASSITDASASGSGAVKFGDGSGGVPAACANGGSYLWSNLATCGWADASNTGYVLSECGGALTPSTLTKDSNGIIHVTTDNTTISCQNISGCVEVEATGVTIKNDLIQACDGFNIRSGANGTGGVMIDDNASATVTQDEINGQKQVHACVWDGGSSMTVSAINCYNIDDGVFSWGIAGSDPADAGDNFTIEDSYFHDFTAATANGHIDGYQTEGASNGLILHNTYEMTSDNGTNNTTDSNIAIWDSNKSSSNITVKDNLMEGGGAAIYTEDYDPAGSGDPGQVGGFSVTGMYFIDNKFSTHLKGSCVGTWFVWFYRGPGEPASLVWPPYYGGPTDDSATSSWTPTNFPWNTPTSTYPVSAGYPSFRQGNTILETGENVDNGNPPGCT